MFTGAAEAGVIGVASGGLAAATGMGSLGGEITGVATATFAGAGIWIGWARAGFGAAAGFGWGVAGLAFPCMWKPHFGHRSFAADCNSDRLKSCVHVGFGQGIVFAITRGSGNLALTLYYPPPFQERKPLSLSPGFGVRHPWAFHSERGFGAVAGFAFEDAFEEPIGEPGR